MNTSPRLLLIGVLLLACTTASAQTPPLTGKMLAGAAQPPVQTTTLPSSAPAITTAVPAITKAAPAIATTTSTIVAEVPSPAPRRSASAADDGNRARPIYRPAPVGTATRNLLRQQVNGSQAGAALPVLGASATLSHQRYLDSFKHPIPERFESRLSEAKPGSN